MYRAAILRCTGVYNNLTIVLTTIQLHNIYTISILQHNAVRIHMSDVAGSWTLERPEKRPEDLIVRVRFQSPMTCARLKIDCASEIWDEVHPANFVYTGLLSSILYTVM